MTAAAFADDVAGLRVLSVLGRSDLTDASLRALDLHRHLGDLGAEVRTVALGPGPAGGLDAVVPVLAPHPRTVAAGLQLRREARWCDVLLLHGVTSATVAHRWLPRRGGMRRVVVLDPVESAAGLPRRGLRRLGGSDLVVTTHALAQRQVVRAGVAAVQLPSVARLPSAVVGDAQRRAARRSLDVAEDVPLLGLAGPLDAAGGSRGAPPAPVVDAAAEAGWAATPVRGDGSDADELSVAACDAVVVTARCPDGSLPRGALVVAAGGGALVGLGADQDGLVADASGAVAGDADELVLVLRGWGTSTRSMRALPSRQHTAEVVRARFSLAESGSPWVRAVRGDGAGG